MSSFTDSKKLQTRINAHKDYSKYDINDWILKQVDLKNGETLLDIGCGTGEQILKFAKLCPQSELCGIDVTLESINIINETCENNKISNVTTLIGPMDNFSNLLNKGKKFDIVNSCFSLYYSNNIPKIIDDVRNILNNNGKFFVCGPVFGNNAELIDFQAKIQPEMKPTHYYMTEDILPEIIKKFRVVKKDFFINPLEFRNPEALIKYWKSYYLFNEKIEKEFINAVKNFFENNDKFITNKKVIGITALK